MAFFGTQSPQGDHNAGVPAVSCSHARKAKMDERGASAVEYGLLVAGIAA